MPAWRRLAGDCAVGKVLTHEEHGGLEQGGTNKLAAARFIALAKGRQLFAQALARH